MVAISRKLWIVLIVVDRSSDGVLVVSGSPSSHHVRLLSWSGQSSLLLLFFVMKCQLFEKLLSLDRL